MEAQRHELGMVGLGAMGRNLLLNMERIDMKGTFHTDWTKGCGR